jgi:hypothetical protein
VSTSVSGRCDLAQTSIAATWPTGHRKDAEGKRTKMAQCTSEIEAKLWRDGWAVVTLEDQSVLAEARDSLLALTRELVGRNNLTLERYHEFVDDDDRHHDIHIAVTDFARRNEYAKRIVLSNLDFFKSILGPDIAMTVPNQWRICRPEKPQDNVGFHRDTDVGHTPFEFNLWLPLVDTSFGCMSGSHLLKHDEIDRVQITHSAVQPGDALNNIGYFYAPWRVDPEKLDVIDVEMGFGELLVFFSPLLHGQEINHRDNTRWSIDFVIANALAPIDWEHHGGDPKYQLISQSQITQVASVFSGYAAEDLVKHRELARAHLRSKFGRPEETKKDTANDESR